MVEAEVTGFGQPARTKDSDFKPLQDLIKRARTSSSTTPSFAAWAQRGDNILMKGVMRALRRVTVAERRDKAGNVRIEPVAHVVLHHTRKESNQYRAPLSPEIMRGAGAVHGVADLVMLARQAKKPETLEIHVSSRSSSIPNFYVQRDRTTLTHKWVLNKKEEKISQSDLVKGEILALLEDAEEDGRRLTAAVLQKRLAEISKREARQIKSEPEYLQGRFDELVEAGDIHIVKGYVDFTAKGEMRANAKFKWADSWFALGPETTQNRYP